MPRLRNARSSDLLIDSSSLGTRCGSASMMVTSAPNDFQTLANSTPMTPPPSTATFFGTKSSSSACSLVMTRPPISRPGSEREYEPVARMTFLPVIVSSPTWTVVGEVEPALALDDRDAARLDQALQALVLLGDDALAVGRDAGDVDALERRC